MLTSSFYKFNFVLFAGKFYSALKLVCVCVCVSLLASEALAEAADITVAAHRSWRAKQAGFQPGYLSYPLLGVGNTVINLLFSWRGVE